MRKGTPRLSGGQHVSEWDAFWSVMSGLAGGFVGAGATMWATNRTLRQQAALSADERASAASDAFDFALRRADQQILTGLTLLRLIEHPSPPFFALDHDALDSLLTYPQLPTRVAFEVERLAAAVRSYNAAANWGNAKHPMAGAGNPAVARWAEARDLANASFDVYASWRGDKLPAVQPLAED